MARPRENKKRRKASYHMRWRNRQQKASFTFAVGSLMNDAGTEGNITRNHRSKADYHYSNHCSVAIPNQLTCLLALKSVSLLVQSFCTLAFITYAYTFVDPAMLQR